tara:strand:- start:39 stop:227 length:189 start_codon:yes stop_codon:yes gene_type:complete
MHDNDLTAFQASQLQYLKTQVERKQVDLERGDSFSSADNELFQAKKELKDFLINLRIAGKNI